MTSPEDDKYRWGTPPALFRALEKLTFTGKFDIDICAGPVSTWAQVPTNFISREEDALAPTTNWFRNGARCGFCNPPYGSKAGNFPGTAAFVERGIQEIQRPTSYAKELLFLLPAAYDTKWFHDVALKANWVANLGRVGFIHPVTKKVQSQPLGGHVAMYFNDIGSRSIYNPTDLPLRMLRWNNKTQSWA